MHQTILGSNGVIGCGLARYLSDYCKNLRLVSRNPRKINDSDQLFSADVTDKNQILDAVKGSDIVYLNVGLKYDIKVWSEMWPRIMTNAIEACKSTGSKLVFFDNVYAYGYVDGWMKEDTQYNPCSKKGEVRAKIASQLMDEVKAGNLQAMIVRAADFYGSNTPLSFVNVTVFERLIKGKRAFLFSNGKSKHSLTYTPDASKATALLGNTPGAYNQIWHLPTDKNVLTGREIVDRICKILNISPKYTIIKTWMLSLLGIFDTILRESVEMSYQNEYDYLFDSSKFENAFDFDLIKYDQGILKTVETYKKKL